MTTWARYLDLARQLDEHTNPTTTRPVEAAPATQAALDALDAKLRARVQDANTLAYELRFKRPDLTGPPAEVGDPAEGLRRAAADEETARLELARAREQAHLPMLLPHASAGERNAVVYTAWAAVAVIAQWIFILTSPDSGTGDLFTIITWTLCGFPTLAVFAGYFTCILVSASRLRHPDESDRPADRSLRLGAGICFAALPVTWGLVKLVAAIFSG